MNLKYKIDKINNFNSKYRTNNINISNYIIYNNFLPNGYKKYKYFGINFWWDIEKKISNRPIGIKIKALWI